MFTNIYIKTEVPAKKNSNAGRPDAISSGTSGAILSDHQLPKQIDTKF